MASESQRQYHRWWRQTHLEQARAYTKTIREKKKAEGICIDCLSRPAIEGRVRCEKWRNRMYAWRRTHVAEIRMDTFDAYGGPVCICCGETEYDFLTLEHSRQDGGEWRRKIGPSEQMFFWLRDHDYPQNLGLEVLCWNCQWGRKNNKGRCPHEDAIT